MAEFRLWRKQVVDQERQIELDDWARYFALDLQAFPKRYVLLDFLWCHRGGQAGHALNLPAYAPTATENSNLSAALLPVCTARSNDMKGTENLYVTHGLERA